MQTLSLIPSFEDIKLHSADNVSKETFEKLSNDIKAFETLANPTLCDEKYLPFLAYAFKVDFWDNNLNVEDKRRLIKSSLLLHRKKGTVWAVEKVLEALNIGAELKEWFDYDADPYHFRVELTISDIQRKIDAKLYNDLKKYIDIYKNVRSILDGLSVKTVFTQDIEVSNTSTTSLSIDKSLKLEKNFTSDVEVSNTSTTSLNIDKSLKLEKSFTQDIKNQQKGVINVTMQTTLKKDLDLTSTYNMQGVAIWQV